MTGDSNGDGYRCDARFYEHQREDAARSANALLPDVIGLPGTGSVLHVGCAAVSVVTNLKRKPISWLLNPS